MSNPEGPNDVPESARELLEARHAPDHEREASLDLPDAAPPERPRVDARSAELAHEDIRPEDLEPGDASAEPATPDGARVGRRLFLGLIGVGSVATLAGGAIARAMRNTVGTLGTERFRIYTVTGSLPAMSRSAYRLEVGGNVANPMTLTFDDLIALGAVTERSDFHCVTGWSVHDVDWTGVKLNTLLDAAGAPDAGPNKWVRCFSFDGVYDESVTMAEARLPENMIATGLNGAPLPQAQGFPARVIIPAMYGYKGTKWVDRIEVTDEYTPGFWVQRGYAQEGWVGNSNGFTS